VSEVIAKYVMVLQATVGESAWTGFSSPFTVEMKNLSKIITSIILTVALVFVLQGIAGLLTLGIVIVVGIIIYYVAYRNFGGVSGDVFGASNEISRLASLLILSTITI
jgi:adenosylcobinamide-GDP ribazoletransferase